MAIGRLAQKMVRQQRDVFRTFGQRRDLQVDHVQAVVEIFAELVAGHHFWQIAVGSGDNSHVNIDIAVAAQRAHFALLQHAQQLDLQRRGHVANFVQEQRAAFRRLEQPFTAAYRTGECAAGMTKQFGFKQLLRERATVNRNKGVLAARAGVMNCLREDLFPGSALAVDEHADVRLRHHPRLFQQTQHHGAARDDRFPPGFIPRRSGMFHRAVDSLIQCVFVHRLGQEAEHPLLRRGNRIRDRPVRGQDNHGHTRLLLLDLREQLQAVHFIHPQVAYHQIDFLAAENFQPLQPAFRGHDAIAFTHQTHSQQL